ncbi:alkaline phosphatase family protein [Pedobacter gandavensis]|uniref:Phosphoesterase n=1 Tax=Pedobacter gandavensis TaxID=2679963 RepID=A0ABR6ESR5_9SPHI|nr:alkaline phosphatase family protein [Pedobacter gandavensis]MBB2148311.1 hypothetical protein [Pedobacter gandavensis]
MDLKQCIITINNAKNPNALVLQSITGPKGSGHAKGDFSPENALFKGLIIPANSNQILSFSISSDFDSGATLTWSTGHADDQSEAEITMTFANVFLGEHVVALTVQPKGENALLAYGTSYFYAAAGGEKVQMGRDYINKSADATDTSVYANFTVAYNSFAIEKAPTNFLPGITNVVMLMLENRSFDHLLGMLYTTNPENIYPAGSTPPAHSSNVEPINFDGLFNNPDFSNRPASGPPVNVAAVSGTMDIPNPDPGEGWLNTNLQVFNTTETPPNCPANMGGFLADYLQQEKPGQPINDPDQIMKYYTSADLPVISSLAKHYAVSDAWHASIPSQTYPNRAFSLTGTSNGYVDNSKNGKPITPFNFLTNVVSFGSNTIFNVLSNCGLDKSWAIYYQDSLLGCSLTEHLFKQLHQYKGTDHIRPFCSKDATVSTFLTDLAQDTLPAFSYLEPAWYIPIIGNGNDYHPPANLCPGEQNLAKIYEALLNYRKWESTLLIITFDEHGGTFDHVPPGATIAADEQTDWSGFQFDRLGIRIPTLLISPLIKSNTVFRSPTPVAFDHTSIIRTLLAWQNIDVSTGVMGARTAQAPDFSGVLSEEVVNIEPVDLNPVVCALDKSQPQLLNDLQHMILPILAQVISGAEHGSDVHKQTYGELSTLKTIGELNDYVKQKLGK